VNRWRRLGLAVVLVGALFGMGVAAQATSEARWPYPSTDAVAADYDQYVGTETLVFGTVETVDGTSARIRVKTSTEPIRLSVTGFDAPVRPGGSVQVFGTLEPDRVIDAERVTVVNPASGSDLFKYAVSGIAVVVFLVVFCYHWRIDVGSVQLEGRNG